MPPGSLRQHANGVRNKRVGHGSYACSLPVQKPSGSFTLVHPQPEKHAKALPGWLGIPFPDPSQHQPPSKSSRARSAAAREVGRQGARRPGKGLRNPRCYDGCLHRRCREGGRSRPRAGCRPERPRPAPPGRVGLPAAAAARPRSPHWVHFPKGPGEAGAEGQLRTALLLHGTCREASPWQLPFLPVLMIEQLRHGASLNL